jgi:hypothetical protein
MTRRLIAATFIVAASVALVAQAPVRDGKWEVTAQMDMPGMPMKMPPMTMTQCITKEQIDDPNQMVPKSSQDKNNSCKVTDYQIDGNKATWKMTCEGAQPMTGNGEIVYAGDAYDGWMKMNMKAGEMTMKYKAKRLGDCVK